MEKILKLALKFVKVNNRYPTTTEMRAIGVSEKQIRKEFGNITEMNAVLFNVANEYLFDLKRSTFRNTPKKKKRYIIVNAVANDKVNRDFYAVISNMCNRLDADLLVTVSVKGGADHLILDPILKSHCIIVNNVDLNSNVSIYGFRSLAKSKDPLTGLKRIGQRSGTFVIGSPKQHLKYVATQKDKLPNAIMSTGSITDPSYYNGELFNLNDFIADNDHVMGGIILEIQDNNTYHFRQLQFKGGVVNDLDVCYTKTNVKKANIASLVLGDWHTGYTDSKVKTVTFEMIKRLSPKTIMLHDFFDGYSVNHHEKGRQILMAKKAVAGMLDLEAEVALNALELKEFAATGKKIMLVDSNHHDFLSKYLEESKYVKHPYNHAYCLKLAHAKSQSKNALEFAIREKGLTEKNVVFMDRDDSFVVAGIELGAHGDKGPNGSRGSVGGLEDAYLNCVVGHAHTPQILRGVYVVGTSTERHAHYGPGHPGSWMNTHGIVYANGQRQLINIIDGKYTIGA